MIYDGYGDVAEIQKHIGDMDIQTPLSMSRIYFPTHMDWYIWFIDTINLQNLKAL